MSPSTHSLAPWHDHEWEKWGLPWDDLGYAHMSRHFEMHDMRLLDSAHSKRKEGYFDRLRDCGQLYIQSPDQRLVKAIVYPFDEVAKTTGAYWNSSIAYAMALAIHEGAEEISLFGVDMDAGDEYGYQKPNMEYLVGLARGRGIKVTIPAASPLCKFNSAGIKFYNHFPNYTDKYGWLG